MPVHDHLRWIGTEHSTKPVADCDIVEGDMADVIPFVPREANDDESHPTVEGPVVCAGCRHEWRGVSPVGSNPDEIECPACGCMKGMRKGLIWPARFWVCESPFANGGRCRSTTFALPETGAPVCVVCGLRANGWVDEPGVVS